VKRVKTNDKEHDKDEEVVLEIGKKSAGKKAKEDKDEGKKSATRKQPKDAKEEKKSAKKVTSPRGKSLKPDTVAKVSSAKASPAKVSVSKSTKKSVKK
jgi:hypothetical protein